MRSVVVSAQRVNAEFSPSPWWLSDLTAGVLEAGGSALEATREPILAMRPVYPEEVVSGF